MTIEEQIAGAVEARLRLVVREEIRAALANMRPDTTTSSSLLTAEDVGERCNATPQTVRTWIHRAEKKLPARKAGRRYLVDPVDLERFLAEQSGDSRQAIDSEEHLAKVMERVNRKGSQ